METISFVGPGRLGGALALALSRCGHRIDFLVSRNSKKAEIVAPLISPRPEILGPDELERVTSEIVFITTQDDEIEGAVNGLGALPGGAGRYVFHTSGSLTSLILERHCSAGWKAGSLHPLISVSDPVSGADRFKGAYFCVEGHPRSAELAERLVRDLSGSPFSVPTEGKVLYHAAAVMACGHLVALVESASEVLQQTGVDPEMAKKVFRPLISSTVSNLSVQPASKALTGTFARGDLKTFERHIAGFSKGIRDDLLRIYLVLGRRSLEIVQQGEGSTAAMRRIAERIDQLERDLDRT